MLEIRKLMKTKTLTTITSIKNINFFKILLLLVVRTNIIFFIEAAAIILIFSIGHLVKIKRNNE